MDKEKKIFVFADFQPYHEEIIGTSVFRRREERNFTLLSMIRNGWKREI